MRKKTYIFRKKKHDKNTSRAIFVSMLGLLFLTPPAIAQAPGLQTVAHPVAMMHQPRGK